MVSWLMRCVFNLAIAAACLVMTGCGTTADDSGGQAGAGVSHTPILRISSIPDQDQDKLSARDGALANYLSTALDVDVEYVPVVDYTASVNLFRNGDLDLVFYGGLTGVQARLQTPGSTLVAQRDIDAKFRSVFIANTSAGIAPLTSVQDLIAFKGKRFTFGSESSTSGRLMPEYFLDQAGLSSDTDLAGLPGYSGSHDKTIDLVESGSFEGGALNIQVWESRLAAGTVDTSRVTAVFTTPPYHDYHWIAGPEMDARFGDGFTDKLRQAMLALSSAEPEQAEILEMFGAARLIPTDEGNYTEIENIGRKLGLIV